MQQIDFETELAKYKGELDGIKSKNNELNSSLGEAIVAPVALLARLFPTLEGKEEQVPELEKLAKEQLSQLEEGSAAKDSQVNHYKGVLAQTESMLNSLQASVESAETEWRLKLEMANKELSEVKMQNSSLAAKASALEASSAIAKQAEEMQVQLAELQQKLTGEEEEKAGLEKVNDEMKKNSEEMTKEVERLSKELLEKRRKKEELSNKVEDL